MAEFDQPDFWSESYLTTERFGGLREQLFVCLATKGSSFLEIGPGPGLLAALLRHRGKQVTTLDHDATLAPDIVADVRRIPCKSDEYDTICAFQALEHLPLDTLAEALREMGRVSRGTVIFSVPDHAGLRKPVFEFRLRIGPRVLRYERTVPAYRALTTGEHHWEIGCGGVETEDVIGAISAAGMQCVKHYLPCAAFHFFLCHTVKC